MTDQTDTDQAGAPTGDGGDATASPDGLADGRATHALGPTVDEVAEAYGVQPGRAVASGPAGEDVAGSAAEDEAQDEIEDPEGRAAADGRTPGELLVGLEDAARERDEYLDALLRSRAEFDNFRRRTTREAAGARQAGVGDLAGRLLDVLDDLDRTSAVAEASHDEGLAAGIQAVHRKLVDALVAVGVERIDGVDVPFDATRHEAVQQVPADAPLEEGPEVAAVLRPGYLHGDRVLRAAMVVVRQ